MTDRAEDIVSGTRAALIVLDAENRFFWTERGGRELEGAAILPNLARVVQAARTRDILRVMVSVAPAPLADAEPWARRRRYLSGDLAERLDASDWGRSIADAFSPREGEIALKKVRTSAFYATPLEVYLRSQSIETVVLAGFATNGAVIATVTDAVSRDFFCFVASDATAGTRTDLHEAALQVIGRENLITTEALCELWT